MPTWNKEKNSGSSFLVLGTQQPPHQLKYHWNRSSPGCCEGSCKTKTFNWSLIRLTVTYCIWFFIPNNSYFIVHNLKIFVWKLILFSRSHGLCSTPTILQIVILRPPAFPRLDTRMMSQGRELPGPWQGAMWGQGLQQVQGFCKFSGKRSRTDLNWRNYLGKTVTCTLELLSKIQLNLLTRIKFIKSKRRNYKVNFLHLISYWKACKLFCKL